MKLALLAVLAVLANLIVAALVVLFAFLAAGCSDTINIYPWPEFDAAPEDAPEIDAPVDATPPDAGPPDARVPGPRGTNLGDPCFEGVPRQCKAPFICAQIEEVCSMSCNMFIPGADHEFCQLFHPNGVCSGLEGLEGRCFVGCTSSDECPVGTVCGRAVSPTDNVNNPFSTYCYRFQ